jgi:flagellar biosynthesis protein FlhB
VSNDKSQKTEKPTPRKLKEAKRNGQIARSPEIASWLGMLVAIYIGRMTAANTIHLGRSLFAEAGDLIAHPETASALHMLSTGMVKGAIIVAPLALGILVTGVVASAAQGGVHVSSKSVKPKFDNLNPFKGLKKVFGVRSIWEATKAVIRTLVLSLLLYQTIKKVVPLSQTGTVVPLDTVLHTMGIAAFSFARNAALAGLLMAIADYIYQYKKMRTTLKMTKQEVKDEYRNSEGDPQQKSLIRSRQMAMRRMRMMRDIATADVVLVNPTHVAVALKYESGRGAPRVVAKGAGAVAARIRAEAEKHRVPMVEDIALARAIYRVCDIGQEIPYEIFMAVARILAFVYSLKRRGSAAGMHRHPATPERDVIGLTKQGLRRTRRKQSAALIHAQRLAK